MDEDTVYPGEGKIWVSDHAGEHYQRVLQRLHDTLKPRTYLEIGVNTGMTMALAKCASIGVDPAPQIDAQDALGPKPLFAMYQMTSDAFFADHNPTAVLGGPIDMAFLDGMHWCEFLLRDFINVERHCRRNSVVVLHDCLPTEQPMAERVHTGTSIRGLHDHSWAGDVWRTALLLKRRRPDLEITAYDAGPTGLVCITSLSPDSTVLADSYAACVREMMDETLAGLGIAQLFAEMQVEPTAAIAEADSISSRFWL